VMFLPNGVTSMTTALPMPKMRPDGYGHARMLRGASVPEPEHIDRVPYGRFRNDYLYTTESCQLRCEHCRVKHAVSPYITRCSGQPRVGRGRDDKLEGGGPRGYRAAGTCQGRVLLDAGGGEPSQA
jgi:hypothetical protein